MLTLVFTSDMFPLPLLSFTDPQEECNDYTVLEEGQDTEAPEGDAQTNEDCVHSSEEDEEKEVHTDDQQDGGADESHLAAHDLSGSRPLLLDSEDEDEQGPQLELHSSAHSNIDPTQQPSTTFDQPTPSTFAENHSQHVPEPAQGTDVAADVFSKAPFRIAQDDLADVFANAPFPRGHMDALQQLDVFSQAPFGKRKEAAGAQPKASHPHVAGVHAVTPEQDALGQVTPQPFRPQALAKYSRHFEGPVPQQLVAAHRVVSNVNRQAAVASVPVGPLHSWTSEVSAVDPFVSAPFHFKAPQEKPWTHSEVRAVGISTALTYANCSRRYACYRQHCSGTAGLHGSHSHPALIWCKGHREYCVKSENWHPYQTPGHFWFIVSCHILLLFDLLLIFLVRILIKR